MSDMASGNAQPWSATKYAYIDPAGKIVINASGYEGAEDFSEGLANAPTDCNNRSLDYRHRSTG